MEPHTENTRFFAAMPLTRDRGQPVKPVKPTWGKASAVAETATADWRKP
jgi:hypothetical protein